MKFIKIFILLTICIAGGVFHNMYKFGYGLNDAFYRVVWSIDEGTIWSKNFSEEAFLKVKVGMSMNEVLHLLGKPLDDLTSCLDGCFWYYTRQDAGTSDFDQRWIVFDQSKKVKEIRKSFFID